MKHLKHLFTALLLLCSTAVAAHDFEVGGVYYNILSGVDKTVEVTSGTNKYTGSVAIPESVTYNGTTYSVTGIGRSAFHSCTGLTSIEIPNSVIRIGDNAFWDCTGLTSVVIPESVISIGDNAFFDCSNLADISIPKSVASVGSSAFYGTAWFNNQADGVVYVGKVLYEYKGKMPSYTSITVEPGTESITSLAFFGKTNLSYLTIPSSVRSIGYNAFYGTSWLDNQADGVVYAGSVLYTYKGTMPANTSIVVKDRVYCIADGAFQECTNLVSIDLNGVQQIGNSAFDGCTNLASVTMSKVVDIGYQAFQSCTSLTNITLSAWLRTMDYGAFRYCTGLTSINIPDKVTSIGEGAFAGCTGLTSVRIGYGVTNISNAAFNNCTALKTVYNNSQLDIVRGSSAHGNVAYYASEVIEHEDYTFTTANGVTTLTKYKGTQSNLILPQYYKGQPYVIGDRAFYGNDNLDSVTIPNTVTSIGDYAFAYCTGLTSVVIGNGVTRIGQYAFYACDCLSSITIPNSVTSIGDWAFYGCESLYSVKISDISAWCKIDFGVSSTPLMYANFLYVNGDKLTDIVVPNDITEIKDYAFYDYAGLTSITIPNSVTSIGDWAFYGCTGLTSVTIGNSVTSIGDWAFNNCTGLKEVHINDLAAWYNISFGSSGANPLYYAKNLYLNGDLVSELVIPDQVTEIKNNAFYGCTGLTSITIPNSVTSIGNSAFNSCTGLTSVTIGNSVTSIGGSAFAYCTGITSITSLIPADALFAVNTNVFNGADKNSCTLYVPYGAKETYASTASWSEFTNIVELIPENALHGTCGADATWILIDGVLTIKGSGGIETNPWIDYAGEIQSIIIEDGITSICNDAFHGCSALTSITIPGSVTSIGSYALTSCTKLTSLIIPGSVTSIGESAFSGCWELSELSVDAANKVYDSRENCNAVIETATNTLVAGCKNTTIPVGVTGIGDNAFRGCVNLENIDIPASVTSIGVRSFSGCGKLANVTVPGSVTSIGDWAFYSCTGLTSVTIGNGVTSIGSYAFRSCSCLTSIVIPNSVTSIGDWAFYSCTGLTSVVIPNSVTHIGEDAFCKCSNLASVQISESLTTIENGVFSRTGLVNVTIPEGVISIGTWAFDNCPALVNVELPSTLTYIGKYAFENDTHLTSIEIPSSVTSIGLEAFDGCTGLTSVTSHIPADALFAVNTNVFNGVDKNNCTLYVPYGAKETYAAKIGWSAFANIVELTPTEVTVNINQYGCATYCSPYALDFSNVEGMKAYAATGYKSNSQVVTLTRVQTAASGIGLFLKGEPGEYLVPVIESTDEHSLNMLVGTLEQTTVNSTDGAMSNYKFTIADGDAAPMFYPFEDGTTLSAGKAYLQIPTAWLPVTAQKSLSVRFDDGETTDIDEVKGEDGKVKGVCYDMQGRVVENPTSGIYIIDGKKVFIK